MTSRLMVALVTAGALVGTTASAEVHRLYLHGAIASGHDYAGYFLPGGGDLAGVAFTAVFSTDDAVGGSEFDNGTETRIEGYDEHNPTTAKLVINGVSAIFGEGPGPTGSEHAGFTTQRHADGSNDAYSRYTDSFLYNDLDDFSWTFWRISVTGSGTNFLRDHDWRTLSTGEAQAAANKVGAFDIWYNHHGYTTLATGTFDITQAAIPEPSAWAIMISGFGLAGAMLRRRRDAPA